jgi:uroporphyrinogen-III synthase
MIILLACIEEKLPEIRTSIYNQGVNAKILDFPVMKYQQVPFEADLSGVDWIVFASAKAVEIFCDYYSNIINLKSFRYAVVGSSQAKVLKKYGVEAEIVSQDVSMASLIEDLSLTEKIYKNSILFVSGENTTAESELKNLLLSKGCQYSKLVVYKTVFHPEPQLDNWVNFVESEDRPKIIFFTSPRSVIAFSNLIEGFKNINKDIQLLCIGHSTKKKAEELFPRLSVIQSDDASYESMAKRLLEF